MGIKVKHDGNATPAVFASAEGGKGKRAQQDAASMAQTMQSATNAGLQQLRGASAPGATPGRTNAQLLHATAPIGGSAGVSGTRGAGLGGTGSRLQKSSTSDGNDYKMLGGSQLDGKPTPDSFWSDNNKCWMRPWRPGEKEAEALDRKLAVQEQYQLTAEGRKERAALVGDITKAIKEGRFSKDEIPQLMNEFRDKEETIRMADSLRDREPTAQQAFDRQTFTNSDGVVFSRDGKLVYDPVSAKAALAEKEKARADKMEIELRKPRKIGEDGEYVERTDDEVNAIMRQRFPNLYPAAPESEGNPAPAGASSDPLIAGRNVIRGEVMGAYGNRVAPTVVNPQNAVQTPSPASVPPPDGNDPYAAYAKFRK